MKIVVNKCPYTGKIFEDNNKYANHLAKLRRERSAQNAKEKIKNEFFGWLAAEKEKICHIDMIIPWILKNQRILMDAHNTGLRCRNGAMSLGWGDKFFPTDKITNISMVEARYSDSVSNTHTCPHNGVTNWGGLKIDAPRGYPGWTCTIEGRTERLPKHMSSYPTSDIFNLVDVKTGSGGGGNESWQWQADIFLADWPSLAQQLLYEKLKGKK